MTQNQKNIDPNLVFKAEYARRKNWSKSYLSQPNVIEKIAPALVHLPNSKRVMIDVKKADEIFSNDIDPAMVRKNGSYSDQVESFADTKNKIAQIKLKNEELNFERLQGQLLYKEHVLSACALAGQKIQEYLKACSRRLAEKLSTISDAREIKSIIDAEFRTMLETISDDLVKKLEEKSQELKDQPKF